MVVVKYRMLYMVPVIGSLSLMSLLAIILEVFIKENHGMQECVNYGDDILDINNWRVLLGT